MRSQHSLRSHFRLDLIADTYSQSLRKIRNPASTKVHWHTDFIEGGVANWKNHKTPLGSPHSTATMARRFVLCFVVISPLDCKQRENLKSTICGCCLHNHSDASFGLRLVSAIGHYFRFQMFHIWMEISGKMRILDVISMQNWRENHRSDHKIDHGKCPWVLGMFWVCSGKRNFVGYSSLDPK